VLPGSPLPPQSWLWAAWGLGLFAVAGCFWVAWQRKTWTPAFGLGWFVLVIAPMLPLRDHVSDYYLTTAGVGIAILFGSIAGLAWQSTGSSGLRWTLRGATAAALAVHLVFALPINRAITRWRYERGERIRVLVRGLDRANELHPGKIILLTGIDSELFWSCLLDIPGRLFGAQEVYLAPGEDQKLDNHVELGNLQAYVAEPGLAARALLQRSAVVYRYEPSALRNLTKQYRRELPPEWLYEKPRMVDVAHPAFASDLGDGWHPSDGTFRWMGKRATIRLAPPRKGERLFVSAFLPLNLKNRATELRIWLNGMALPTVEIPEDSESVEGNLLITEGLQDKTVEIRLEVDRTVRLPGDETEYGLAFGKVGFR
jgi:hypothetical protein